MEKGFYHPERGYWQTNSDPGPDILEGYPAGTVEVPLMPSVNHMWSGSQWVLRPQSEIDALSAAIVRGERNHRLVSQVDPVVSNPLRWADMTAEKQAEWTVYRRALLDITAQAGFPHSVVWPTKPE